MTRAARKLHVAQPALSQAIAQLESELGIELLVRHPRGVTLTAAGEAFLPKARNAVATERDAKFMADSLARAARGYIEVGFVGPPPMITSPELFAAFSDVHPEAEVSFRDLLFPSGPTTSWLQDVDLAVCHPPAIEEGVAAQTLRVEPRAVVVPRNHRLAGRLQVSLEDVLDEAFISYHPDVQPAWAGFHSLDDHRGAPPLRSTVDHALSSLQMVGIMTCGRAITTVPLSDAKLAVGLLPAAVALPVSDADPALVSLLWRSDGRNRLVAALVEIARDLARDSVDQRLPNGA